MPQITVRVENRHLSHIKLRGATVSIAGTTISGMTNAAGIARLDATGLANGAHVLGVVPANTTTAVAGPTLAEISPPAGGIYRSLDVHITTRDGRLTAATAPTGRTADGVVRLQARPRLVVSLQPVFMASPNHSPRPGSIDLIVIHHTAGTAPISPGFMASSGRRVSPHYVIPVDGQVVKMVRDSEVAWHAGGSRWKGRQRVNDFSIGIEIVHRSGPYQAAQYASLLVLLNALLTTHTSISRDQIVGHSDVGVNAAGVLGRKSTDPGVTFEWTRLAARNMSLGYNAMAGPQPDTIYGGFFALVPGGTFRRGDNDARHVFGGRRRPTVTGASILELQGDLEAIGYSISKNGSFDLQTARAVQMLQEHFHQSLAQTGAVGFNTAAMIKSL